MASFSSARLNGSDTNIGSLCLSLFLISFMDRVYSTIAGIVQIKRPGTLLRRAGPGPMGAAFLTGYQAGCCAATIGAAGMAAGTGAGSAC